MARTTTLQRNLDERDRALMILERRNERKLVKAYADGLRDARGELAALYERYAVNGKLTYSEMSKYNRLDGLLEDLKAELMRLEKSVGGDIRKLAGDAYQESFYRTAFAIESTAQARLRFGLLNPKVIEASVQNPLSGLTLNKRLERRRAEIIVRTREQITQGLIRGESYTDMARRIKVLYEGNATKSLRIARTEAHRNQSAGGIGSMQQAVGAGVDLVKVWDATLDMRTRSTHGAADGQKVAPDEKFTVGGIQTDGPGLSGVAEEDINCRCRMRLEIVGYSPELRRVRGEGVVPYKTYSEWAEAKGIK